MWFMAMLASFGGIKEAIGFLETVVEIQTLVFGTDCSSRSHVSRGLEVKGDPLPKGLRVT